MKLQMAVKNEYFVAMKAGEKTEEYRLANAYWVKKLFQPDGRPQEFDCVVITDGYPKSDDHERILTFEWRGFTRKTITHPHFGLRAGRGLRDRCQFPRAPEEQDGGRRP
jgi:hypothetical protein